jgi:hypothetical protein
VLNAFALLFLVSSVYAVLATDFFGENNTEHFGDFMYGYTRASHLNYQLPKKLKLVRAELHS